MRSIAALKHLVAGSLKNNQLLSSRIRLVKNDFSVFTSLARMMP